MTLNKELAGHKKHAGEQDLAPSEPSRARALLSTADFRLIRAALASHARTLSDRDEMAKVNALFHRLGNYD